MVGITASVGCKACEKMKFRNVINHEEIQIDSDIQKILDTSQFQRLAKVKQHGCLYKILESANYTRDEHCVGTYYLAGRMLKALESNTPNYDKIPPLFISAVQIAALLHDIGHAAFSHTWERVCKRFEHEKNAAPCVDAIFAAIGVEHFAELRAQHNLGIELIKALIIGESADFLQRFPNFPKQYLFIFEIVSNSQCSLDVDKWDYLKRDYSCLKEQLPKVQINDIDGIFLNARISDDGRHIEYRYADYAQIYALFVLRYNLFRHCYRLPRAIACDKIIEHMVNTSKQRICDRALIDIDARTMDAFLQLTDPHVIDLLKDHEWFTYFDGIKQLPIINDAIEPTAATSILRVSSEIEGPGKVMPDDEAFHFYGDIKNKKDIIRNTEIERCTTVFRLQ